MEATSCTVLYLVHRLEARRLISLCSHVLRLRAYADLCTPPSSLMASFGRRYDGLHLMYLPLVLHYGGLLAFVDKGGTDCQQLRLFMEKFAQTVSPCKQKTLDIAV